MAAAYRQETHPALGAVSVLTVDAPEHRLTVSIAPRQGSNIFSFTVGSSELIWCDIAGLAQGAFTGNFVVAPIAANREAGRRGSFQGQQLDFHDIPIPEGDPSLVHGFARLLEWSTGEPEVENDNVRLDTSVRYGRDDQGRFLLYCEKAYPYDVIHTHRHVLSRDGLTVYASFENRGDRPAPVAHTLHANLSTALAAPERTLISVPASQRMEKGRYLPRYPITLQPVAGTRWDLRSPRPVSDLWLDDYYTDLDPSLPARFDPTTSGFFFEITASPEYQHCIVFTRKRDRFVAIERQTSMVTALKAYAAGLRDLANLLVVQPGETKTIWTRYRVVANT